MFYRTADGHNLRKEPLNMIVVPRPIGWISTVDAGGRVNLAPYSFFNAVAYKPPQVMFAATTNHAFGGLKDSVANVEATGEFVVNLATYELREQMNASAVNAPREVDELALAGLTTVESELVRPPRVAESPVHLECRHTQTVQLLTDDEQDPNTVVFGHVVGVHIADWAIVDGAVDTLALQPIGRLGDRDYVHVRAAFSIDRPAPWSD